VRLSPSPPGNPPSLEMIHGIRRRTSPRRRSRPDDGLPGGYGCLPARLGFNSAMHTTRGSLNKCNLLSTLHPRATAFFAYV
jgi:hypothetical protein